MTARSNDLVCYTGSDYYEVLGDVFIRVFRVKR